MRRKHNLRTGALCLAAILLVSAAVRADDDEVRVIKKIRIHCEEGDCERHTDHEGDGHSFSWFSADGPGHFAFATHVGGGFIGVALTELTPELRTHFGVAEDEGVMISKVLDNSPALRAGLEVGDIITAVDGERVGSSSALGSRVRHKEDGDVALLEVWRDGSVQNISATVEERERKGHGMHHAFAFDCEDDDCGQFDLMEHGLGIECDEGPCKIKIECDDDGACLCTVDGEETDCGQLHRDKR
jgi:hypothetical protein